MPPTKTARGDSYCLKRSSTVGATQFPEREEGGAGEFGLVAVAAMPVRHQALLHSALFLGAGGTGTSHAATAVVVVVFSSFLLQPC